MTIQFLLGSLARLWSKSWNCKLNTRWEHEFLIVHAVAHHPDAESYLLIQRRYDPTQEKYKHKDLDKQAVMIKDAFEYDQKLTQTEATTKPSQISTPDADESGSSSSGSSVETYRNVLELAVRAGSKLSGLNRMAVDSFTTYRSLTLLQNDITGTGTYTVLSTVQFPDPSPLTFEHLLVACKIVSLTTPQYNLLVGQCYWFAYSVWAILKLAFPDQFGKAMEPHMEKQGTCKLLSTFGGSNWKYGSGGRVHPSRKPQALHKIYSKEWSEFERVMLELKLSQDLALHNAEERVNAAEFALELERQNAEAERQKAQVEREKAVAAERQKAQMEREKAVAAEKQKAELERQKAELERKAESYAALLERHGISVPPILMDTRSGS